MNIANDRNSMFTIEFKIPEFKGGHLKAKMYIEHEFILSPLIRWTNQTIYKTFEDILRASVANKLGR